MRFASTLPFLMILAACAAPPPPRAPQREPEPARARAALATVLVDNRSAERLVISYRLTSRTRAEVGIGRVDARSTAELAPVPAGEPLILIARTAAGGEFVLPPRTFDIDGHWSWVIPADARFSGGAAD